jgi:hypothetical protein
MHLAVILGLLDEVSVDGDVPDLQDVPLVALRMARGVQLRPQEHTHTHANEIEKPKNLKIESRTQKGSTSTRHPMH